MVQEEKIIDVCSICIERKELIRSHNGDAVCCDSCLESFMATFRDLLEDRFGAVQIASGTIFLDDMEII